MSASAKAAKAVPWFFERFRGPGSSVCNGHWLEIRNGAKICHAQWEDVGPFCTDSAGYVFGDQRRSPNVSHGAGIDLSPAVQGYLGLGSLGLVDRRFVEQSDVPDGPWSLYDREMEANANSVDYYPDLLDEQMASLREEPRLILVGGGLNPS